MSIKSSSRSHHTDVWIFSEFEDPENQNHLPEIIKRLRVLFPGFFLQEKAKTDTGANNEYCVFYGAKDMRRNMFLTSLPVYCI